MAHKQEKSINNIIKSNLKLAGKKVPVTSKLGRVGTFTLPKILTEDQAAGRTPVYTGKDFEYFLNGDGVVVKHMKTTKNLNGGKLDSIVNLINSHNIDFVNRLKDPNRKSIKDWENPSKIATHKMGVGTDENGNTYIYPEVQQINGKLIDFTRPPYDGTAGMISAEERGDTIHVKNIEDGLLFTQNYKRYYPGEHKQNILDLQKSNSFQTDWEAFKDILRAIKEELFFKKEKKQNGGKLSYMDIF